ncbi:MAG: type I-U CRISPR-associated protein Cas7 [Deltaproteobacteria bacterium]|nr:type I-U CRISPR-associated protein Cas7 [Deltaproteobacteria bacterium]
MTALVIGELRDLVKGNGTAVRVRQRLQPAGGPGDKVFPPTFGTGENKLKYALEDRCVGSDDALKKVVLLDSVASQANRMEEALLAAWESSALAFPVIGVDFAGEKELVDIGLVTTLQAPHRIADAILRDATNLDGNLLFRDTPEGRAYTDATPRNASAVYLLCPTALVFGVWDSTGHKGGLGAKFARALTSEIVGIGATTGSKVSSRLDPLAIGANVQVFHHKDNESEWTITEDEAKKEKGKPVPFSRGGKENRGKPSAVNHSNIPPSIDELAGGVTFEYALQTVVLSLPALRRLRFATTLNGEKLPERPAAEDAARVALAALGLAAIVHLRDRGYDLRSRCLLVPDSELVLEVVKANGSVETRTLDAAGANALVAEAQKAAAAAGLAWQREPMKLKPAAKLVALIKRSRREASTGAD